MTVTGTACDRSSSPTSPTQPSSPPPIQVPLVLYDTLNPLESRAKTQLWTAISLIDSFGRLQDWAVMFDDFMPSASGQIRTVTWQGGYCDWRFTVPPAVPAPVARSFRITFTEDRADRPALISFPNVQPLSETTLTPNQVSETRIFDLLQNPEWGCGSRFPAPFSYYSYRATLPTPFAVTAGQRYWVGILADVGSSGLAWGWRAGAGGDGRSYSGLPARPETDLAFSLLSQ